MKVKLIVKIFNEMKITTITITITFKILNQMSIGKKTKLHNYQKKEVRKTNKGTEITFEI